MIIRILTLALGLLASLPTQAESPPPFTAPLERDHPLIGTIWQPATGERLSPADLANRVAAARVVLLGETHDNPDHHALQAWLVREATAEKPAAVAFEMIAADKEAALRDHLARHPGDTAGLALALEWRNSGWPDWNYYRPIFDAALRTGGPILPANLSRDDTRALGRGKAPDLARDLAIDKADTPDIAASMAADIAASHCGMLPEKAIAPMVQVQRARDATMARAVRQGLTQAPVAILIAGAGHTRTDRGVPRYLEVSAGPILSVAFIEVQSGETDPASYGSLYDTKRLPFDVVMFTPRVDREDPCQAFRKHMEKRKTSDTKVDGGANR